jgi:hypothetical protein
MAIYDFKGAKTATLVALYKLLHEPKSALWLDVGEVQNLVPELSSAYLDRVMTSLANEDLVEYSSGNYAITEQGILVVEQQFSDSLVGAAGAAPASDRIVALNHNQVSEADRSVSELVDQLENDNGDPDQPGLRERLLGQIKAGRELIRAGEFRAYLLYETLVRALYEIVNRYRNPTIVALANALLGAVVSQLLQAK